MTCEHCQGYVHVGMDDTYCLICGRRPKLKPIQPVYREVGSFCSCGKPSEERTGLCRYCQQRRYAGHAEKISKGMFTRRACRRDECTTLCEAGMVYCADHRPLRDRYKATAKPKPTAITEAVWMMEANSNGHV